MALEAAHLLLAALLVPLDEDVLLEQVDVVEGLEQHGRLAEQRLAKVRGGGRVGGAGLKSESGSGLKSE